MHGDVDVGEDLFKHLLEAPGFATGMPCKVWNGGHASRDEEIKFFGPSVCIATSICAKILSNIYLKRLALPRDCCGKVWNDDYASRDEEIKFLFRPYI